ncbi:pimeloyl-ACP methyl ester carboxylesterase [Kitasatospora sp. GAS204A]|uniref:alpha/beta fold hydrolase n=1 Tax=unclassified Kitasatospora TaxID=2633591 RepID=UPI002473385C|nr:alpha/beta hydrolase [Kitasatospora sp. GAS204B]MDH6116506.1 pimeloyl-ACP methyl ester carboxylesterase [Kitasatospora sp. GAS204B]
MSTPPFLDLPACAAAVRLATTRGEFAVLRAEPAGPVRGTVLLVPGFTGSKEDFIGLLEPFSDAGFRAVGYDQRGQYETGGPADQDAYALPELALDLLAVTESLTAEGAGLPHLLGHSFGGMVAREAVLAAPAPLPWASLVLLSTGPGPLDPPEADRTRMLMDALPVWDLETIWQVKQQMAAGEDDSTEELAPELSEFLHRRWLANVPQALLAMGERLVGQADRTDELAAVPLPKLYVSGEADYAWPVEEQARTAERLGSRHVVVPGAGHSPNAEQPDRTAAELLAFWSSVTTG